MSQLMKACENMECDERFCCTHSKKHNRIEQCASFVDKCGGPCQPVEAEEHRYLPTSKYTLVAKINRAMNELEDVKNALRGME